MSDVTIPQSTLDEIRAALEFYAKGDNYRFGPNGSYSDPSTMVEIDRGRKAASALAALASIAGEKGEVVKAWRCSFGCCHYRKVSGAAKLDGHTKQGGWRTIDITESELDASHSCNEISISELPA